jgi:hypothetical protein
MQVTPSGKICSSCHRLHQLAKPQSGAPVRTRRRTSGGVGSAAPWNPVLIGEPADQKPAIVCAQPPQQGQGSSASDSSDISSSTVALTRAARIDTGDAIEELQVCVRYAYLQPPGEQGACISCQLGFPLVLDVSWQYEWSLQLQSCVLLACRYLLQTRAAAFSQSHSTSRWGSA